MAKYLITGVAGFIGSNLARALAKHGNYVRGIDNLATGKRGNLADLMGRIEFAEADLLDTAALAQACAGIDYVFHEAAIPSVPKSVKDPVSSNRANVDGTLNLLLAARDAGVKRVVYAASSSAYGNVETLPKHEAMIPHPISPYAVSKLAGEMYMSSFYQCYGLETVCLRYFNVFGPHQDPSSPYSGVLAKFIMQMLRGERPAIHGDGEQSRDFTYIDNVVAGNLLACHADAENVCGRVFNVACASRITLNEIVAMLKPLTGYAGEVSYGPDRAGDVKHSLADISLARTQFGYEPLVGIEEGLRRTVAWYREQLPARPHPARAKSMAAGC